MKQLRFRAGYGLSIFRGGKLIRLVLRDGDRIVVGEDIDEETANILMTDHPKNFVDVEAEAADVQKELEAKRERLRKELAEKQEAIDEDLAKLSGDIEPEEDKPILDITNEDEMLLEALGDQHMRPSDLAEKVGKSSWTENATTVAKLVQYGILQKDDNGKYYQAMTIDEAEAKAKAEQAEDKEESAA